MYYQNIKNDFLYKKIQSIGCFFLSCVNVCELITGKQLEKRKVNIVWDWSKRKKYINDNNDIVKSDKIISHILGMLGSEKTVIEIGVNDGVKNRFYNWVTDDYKKECIYIEKIKTENNNTHFRVVDKDNKNIFDSYYPIPQTKEKYYTIIYSVRG